MTSAETGPVVAVVEDVDERAVLRADQVARVEFVDGRAALDGPVAAARHHDASQPRAVDGPTCDGREVKHVAGAVADVLARRDVGTDLESEGEPEFASGHRPPPSFLVAPAAGAGASDARERPRSTATTRRR